MKRSFSTINKIISFVFPKEIEVFSSKYNMHYEVVLDGGKLVFNTKEANYSFGQLHRVFQKTFKKIDLKNREIDKVLILGFGVGSVAQILNKEYKIPRQIVGVEIDQVIINIGYDYFKLDEINNLQLVVEEARHYILNCTGTFDLIVIDVFEELEVPKNVLDQSFFIQIAKLLEPKGIALLNFIVNNRASEDMFGKVLNLLEQTFTKVSVFKTMGINRVFLLENNP